MAVASRALSMQNPTPEIIALATRPHIMQATPEAAMPSVTQKFDPIDERSEPKYTDKAYTSSEQFPLNNHSISNAPFLRAGTNITSDHVSIYRAQKDSIHRPQVTQPHTNIKSAKVMPTITMSTKKTIIHGMSLYSCSPSARDRQDPADFKGWKLDFDGKPMVVEVEGMAPGVLSYWNLDNKEEIFAIYNNGKQADGSVVNVRFIIHNEEEVKVLYDNFKGIIVQACTVNMFRGGAFADKVKIDSPLDDTLQLIYWSPVMTKEHRWYFAKVIFSLYAKIVSYLKARKPLDRESIEKYQLELLGIRNFFDSDKNDPPPMPIDISPAWQKEFGDAWIKRYALALRGGPNVPFHITVPPECYRDKDGLTIKGWDVSMKRLYAGDLVVGANTQTQMLVVSTENSSDYAEVMRTMGTKKGQEQVAIAGSSKSSSGDVRGIGAEYGEEYTDRFEGAIIDAEARGVHLKDMLDKAAVEKQIEEEKKAAEIAKRKAAAQRANTIKARKAAEKAAAQLVASEEAAKRKENKKGGSSAGTSLHSKKGNGKGKK